jgi:hypothetical protein
VQNVQISGNEIHINDLKTNMASSGIELVDMQKGLIQNNIIAYRKRSGGKQSIAIIYNRVSAVQQMANQVNK